MGAQARVGLPFRQVVSPQQRQHLTNLMAEGTLAPPNRVAGLGAYIQHRWYNPTMPRQTENDVLPYVAPLYGLGALLVGSQAWCTARGGMWDHTSSACRSPYAAGVQVRSRVGVPRRMPLGSLLPIGEASEWFDFIKIAVWVAGGLAGGYLAGFLFRELRTANRGRPRRRNRRRNRRR